MVKYIRQSSLIQACQRPVRSSYFFARKEGWRRSRSRFVSCLPKPFWTSGGLTIRLAANGSLSTARMGFDNLHRGAGRLEWSEDAPRLHRRIRFLELPCREPASTPCCGGLVAQGWVKSRGVQVTAA